MPLYNPYRQYDKGMDDAYSGRDPKSSNSQYITGYNRLLQIAEEERRRDEEKEQYEAMMKDQQK